MTFVEMMQFRKGVIFFYELGFEMLDLYGILDQFLFKVYLICVDICAYLLL